MKGFKQVLFRTFSEDFRVNEIKFIGFLPCDYVQLIIGSEGGEGGYLFFENLVEIWVLSDLLELFHDRVVKMLEFECIQH